MPKPIRIPQKGLLHLNVVRFGAGYWIGAICTTLVSLLITFRDSFDSSDDDPIVPPPGIFLYYFLLLALAGIMMGGVLLSAKDFQNGRRLRDSSVIMGSILGLLLNSWPFVYFLASWAAYHMHFLH